MTGAQPPPTATDLPRLAIERTPANDVYLLLSGLGLGAAAEGVLADPLGSLAANRAEVVTVLRLVQARVASATAGGVPAAEPPHGPADRPSTPNRTGRRPAARDEAGRPLRPGSSLLR